MNWKRSPETNTDPAFLQALISRFSVSPILARALLRRGLTTEAAAAAFLAPEKQPLPDPFALKDMDKAAALLKRALAENWRICVYGDYDADGVCATAILLRCLRKQTDNLFSYIPSRHKEGYGMNKEAVRLIKERGAQLIVTVDNGVSAFAEIEYAGELGMEVIVTDHHRCQETLPAAAAVVCVSRDGYRERVNDLCGAGAAYLLARAVEGGDGEEYLPLVAEATVADVVALNRENRTLLCRGMKKTKDNPGLFALLKAAGADAMPLTETALAYYIAPRLNAAGRMGDANAALELLLTEDEGEASLLAERLNNENDRRRAEEQRILSQCWEMLRGQNTEAPVLLLVGEDWNSGVVGIVASRLCESLYKPVILLTKTGETYSGSGRSIPEIDLFRLLDRCSDTLLRFGGHAGAAGLTVAPDRLPALREALLRSYALENPGEPPIKTLYYEDELSMADCTLPLCRGLERLAPFGQGNEEPVFQLSGVPLNRVNYLGKDKKHLSAYVGIENPVRLVAFGEGKSYEIWRQIARADILLSLRKNAFRGIETPQINCIALLEAEEQKKSSPTAKIIDAFLLAIRYNEVDSCLKCANVLLSGFPPIPPTEEELRTLYSSLRQKMRQEGKPLPFAALLPEEKLAALVFLELGFYEARDGDLTLAAGAEKRSCSRSILFRELNKAPAQGGKEHGSQG